MSIDIITLFCFEKKTLTNMSLIWKVANAQVEKLGTTLILLKYKGKDSGMKKKFS